MLKRKVRITKCYLVQIVNDDGDEIVCEYVFGDRSEAEKAGKALKQEYQEDEEE